MAEIELKELNEQLAKAVGIEKYNGDFPEAQGTALWKLPGSYGFYDTCPDFTSSMDACIKWIVPVLRSQGRVDGIQFIYRINGNVDCFLAGLKIKAFCRFDIFARAGSEPLAFCLAADKYFSEENCNGR